MNCYKVLGAGRVSCHGGTGKWTPGRWRSVHGELKPCSHALHFCRAEDLILWLNAEIWEAECDDEAFVHESEKLIARRGRIIRKCEHWNEANARLFAGWCARRVLPLFERQRPDDKRPRAAIETAEQYARGEATAEELDAAWYAAGPAAGCAERKIQTDALMQLLNTGELPTVEAR